MASIEGRTIRTFLAESRFWTILEAWADQLDYKLIEHDECGALYKKRPGKMVKVTAFETGIMIEAWLKPTITKRIMTLYLISTEIKVDSGSILFKITRNKFREDVNLLFQQLDLPVIQ